MENQNYKDSNPTSPTTELPEEATVAIDEMDEEAAAKERLTSDDPTKVKFINANSEYTRKNGDAKVDIENVQRSVGMGKEELMKYANDPFWVRLRMTLFVGFWFLWIAMLVGSVVIIIVAPRCPPPPTLDWWQKTVVYQVMVASYKDSDGNGRGDLKGLISKLDYLQENKINTLLLSNIFKSNQHADYGIDITSFTEVDSQFGNLDDFDSLVEEADKRGMKLLLEFVPNHTSEKHPWFLKSEKEDPAYADYYIWLNGTGNTRSAPKELPDKVTTWSDKRKLFYMHRIDSDQPELNFSSSSVRQEMTDILLFWLERGVDGFFVKHFDHLVEEDKWANSKNDQLKQAHPINQPSSIELLQEWREFIDTYSQNSTSTHKRIILTSLSSEVNASFSTELYGNSSYPLSDVPFYTGLINIPNTNESQYILQTMNSSINSVPSDLWPNWVLGTSETKRLASRVGEHLVDAIHTITLLSKGTPIVYYGDEIGMENTTLADKDVLDPTAHLINKESNDPVRTPMQWDNTTFAGFSTGRSFMPISKHFNEVNVMKENATAHSHLRIFRSLMTLRSNPSIQFGSLQMHASPENVFSMVRVRKGNPGYLIVVNFGNDTNIDLTKTNPLVNDDGKIELATVPLSGNGHSDSGHPTIKLSDVALAAKQTIVFSFVPNQV